MQEFLQNSCKSVTPPSNVGTDHVTLARLLYSTVTFIVKFNESFYVSNLVIVQRDQARGSTGSRCLVLSVEGRVAQHRCSRAAEI
jgi:hypothetical protein